MFELDDLGAQQLKGFAEPVLGWRVIGERRTEGRFEARQTAGLTPLVGREEEMALLLRRWQQAKDGEGQVVLLSGEPGIGKSRLVHELRRQLEGEPHTRILYQCSPHHMTSPLHPVVVQLERAAGFARDDPPEARLEKLEALLARGTDRLDQAVPLVAALLGLSTAARWPALGLSPQRQKQRTLEALVEQLEGLSSHRAGAARVRGRALARPDHAGAFGPDHRARPAPAGRCCLSPCGRSSARRGLLSRTSARWR